MNDDKLILSEFKKALRRSAKDNIIDFDESFSQKFDFQIHRFEDVLRDTNRTIPPNRWSHYRIGLLKKGSGEFTTGIYKFKAAKNTLIVIPARVITSSKNWSLDMEGYIALFNMEFFLQHNFPRKYIESKKILTSSIQPYLHLADSQAAEIEEIFETMLKERASGKANSNELIAMKVIEVLILSERLFDEEQHFETTQPLTDLIRQFIDLLETNFLRERTVRFYAEQLAVHPNYLNALVKKHTGVTAKESIQNRLLLETKYLLHSTNLSIKEISGLTGFRDPNYFSSFFSRSENMSPGHYRTQFV